MSRARLCTGWWPLLLIGMSVHASLSATPAAAVTAARQQEAADLCLQYVSVRLGHLMGLHVVQTKAPQPPAVLWLVTGEDRQGTPPVSFVCALRYQPAQQPDWSLEKLDLLQLNSASKQVLVP